MPFAVLAMTAVADAQTGSRLNDRSSAVANWDVAGSAGYRTSAASPAPHLTSAQKEEQANRRISFDYARCVVASHHDRAADAILADESNGGIMKRYPDLIDSRCLGRVAGSVQMKFGGDLYRYALADALVNADFVASGPSTFDDRLPLAHLQAPDQQAFDADIATIKNKRQQDARRQEFARDSTTSWLSSYGECVARRDPVDARLWLLTPPATPEETSRIYALRPAFSACLNGTMSFTRLSMRGAVALNYYRLAKSTPMPAAGKAN